jgi:hypothetical protein
MATNVFRKPKKCTQLNLILLLGQLPHTREHCIITFSFGCLQAFDHNVPQHIKSATRSPSYCYGWCAIVDFCWKWWNCMLSTHVWGLQLLMMVLYSERLTLNDNSMCVWIHPSIHHQWTMSLEKRGWIAACSSWMIIKSCKGKGGGEGREESFINWPSKRHRLVVLESDMVGLISTCWWWLHCTCQNS